MFPMPNLPTDNLYKLSAIFGLIGIFFSIYFTSTVLNKLTIDVFELKKQNELFEVKAKFLREDETAINKKIDKIDEVLSLYKKTSIENDSIDLSSLLYGLKTDKNLRDYYKFKYEYFNKYHLPFKLQNELNRLIELNIEKYRELELLNVEFVSNFDIVGHRIKENKKYKIWIFILLIFSNLLFLFGILMWYFKVQRHLDKKIATYSLENNSKNIDLDS